jgi:anti-sigma B factor antagonist
LSEQVKGAGMIATETHGDVTVVIIETDLDATKSQKAKQLLGETIQEGNVKIVVDLSSVAFIDSSGLGALVSALKRVRPSGGDVRICGASKEVETIFELTRLTKVFRMFGDRQTALASFQRNG